MKNVKMMGTMKVYGILALIVFSLPSMGQSDSLQVRYDELINNSETYQQYKVIVKSRLDQLWSEVQDSISRYQKALTEVQQYNQKLEREKHQALANSEELATRVAELKTRQGTINFLGSSLSVGLYHVLVWGLIILLIVALVAVYGISMRSRVIAKNTTADFEHLQREMEQFRERTREKEVKIKRELQTALNNLEELKRRSKK